MQSNETRLLLTGFEPFGSFSVNPSWESVSAITRASQLGVAGGRLCSRGIASMAIPSVTLPLNQERRYSARRADDSRNPAVAIPAAGLSPPLQHRLFGLERLHPFDSKKYGRAWRELRSRFGRKLHPYWVKPPRPVTLSELLTVHTAEYLKKLRSPRFLAGVLEIPPLRYLLGCLADRWLLRPMRWATMGTIVAAGEAMRHGLAINLSGGYHHASPSDGHGFCAYADVGLAVHHLRASSQLGDADKIVYVDLDAHQGNGVCRTFLDDPRVLIYDQYNRHIFPLDVRAQRRIDRDVPVADGCSEGEYLRSLKSRLPTFLDSVTRGNAVKLAVYNAGSDIYQEDQLGRLNVSAAGVVERDQFVLRQLIDRGIPTAVLMSGGYSRESYRLVAQMIGFVLETWAGLSGVGPEVHGQ